MPEADDGDDPVRRPAAVRARRPRLFFGRDARDRASSPRWSSPHRVVLLYAASGAGKTSLLNAGLVPLLEEERVRGVPPARVAGGGRRADARERVATSTCSATSRRVGEGRPDAGRASRSRSSSRGPASASTTDGFPAPRALVFDQFEELFTLYPERWRQREAFFAQLARGARRRSAAARRPRDPRGLRRAARPVRVAAARRAAHAFRLERLGAEPALRRGRRSPLQRQRGGTSRRASPRSSSTTCSRSASTPARGEPVEVAGEFVEPVQLQVVVPEPLGRASRRRRRDHRRTPAHVRRRRRGARAFYDDAVAAAAAAGACPRSAPARLGSRTRSSPRSGRAARSTAAAETRADSRTRRSRSSRTGI